jgi:hypothetical protein
MDMPAILLNILKEAPQLSSLNINLSLLESLFKNGELNKYLNERIKKLYVYSNSRSTLFTNDNITRKFCKIFSNLEQLSYEMKEPRYLVFLLKQLSKLSMIKVSFYMSSLGRNAAPVDLRSFFEEVSKLNMLFRTNYTRSEDSSEYIVTVSHTTILTIWIDNNIK